MDAVVILARAYAKLGQFEIAWRSIGEAMTAVETTKERTSETDIHCIAGEIELMFPEPDPAKAETLFRARPRRRLPTTSQVMGTPRLHEPRPPLARPGQGAASARTAFSGLRVVYGRLRHP